jgi:hypothetical protein
MSKMPVALLTAFLSFSTFADVSFEEKKNRVEFLEELSSMAITMNIDAYRRELQYEQAGLSLATRAKIESNRLAEQIKIQIQKSFETIAEDSSSGEAVDQIRKAVEKDLELIAPDLRDEVRRIAFEALENVEAGGQSAEGNLGTLNKKMLKNVRERHEFLNKEGETIPHKAFNIDEFSTDLKNPNNTEYSNRSELVKSLVSEFENADWVSASNTNVKSNVVSKTSKEVSFQLKAEFLGVSIDAGPTISFTREFKTSASVIAEGLSPILLADGNFDFAKRDSLGRAIESNGKIKRRQISFSCDASLAFESSYTGEGGFSIAGFGGGVSIEKEFSNNVNLTSRRILVPEYIDGKSVTLKLLSDLCHNDFLSGKVTNTMTISDSLNVMMTNVISGLTFSHPKTKCMTDDQCERWFNHEVIGLATFKNTPRCVEEKREKFRACVLRGLKGQNCSVYDAQGRRVSDGMFEYQCDTGLKCVKVKEEGWFKNWEIYQHARGKCMPAAEVKSR